MILPRFLTALVGVPLLVLAVWWGHIPFFVLIFGVVMLSLYEFYTLAGEADWPLSKFTGLLLGAGLIAAVYLFGTRTDWTRGWAGAAETALPAMLTGTILVLVLKPLFCLLEKLLLISPELKTDLLGLLRKLALEFPCEPEFKIFEEVSHCGAVLKHEICSLQCILRRLFCRFFPVCKLYFERPTPFHPGDRLFPHAQFNSCQRLVLIESEKRL